MLRAVPIFLLSLSVRIRSTRGIMVSLSINTNTGDSGFTFEGWIHPFSSSAPTHDYLFKTHTTDYRDVRVIVENCSRGSGGSACITTACSSRDRCLAWLCRPTD